VVGCLALPAARGLSHALGDSALFPARAGNGALLLYLYCGAMMILPALVSAWNEPYDEAA